METYHSYRAIIESTIQSIREEIDAVDAALGPFLHRALPPDAEPFFHDAIALSKRARMQLAHLTQTFYEGDALFWRAVQRANTTGISWAASLLRHVGADRYVAQLIPRSRERITLQSLYAKLQVVVSTQIPNLSHIMDKAVRHRSQCLHSPPMH